MQRGLIGIFDSGVGGLTVAARVQEDLPGASYIYFGDTAHVPYGNRSADDVIGLVSNIARHLVDSGAEALVMACNTSSALALDSVRSWCPVPVIGIIEAAARAAVFASRNGQIGLIANPLTAGSGAYERAAGRTLAAQGYAPTAARIFPIGCPKLVPLVEAGEVSTPTARAALLEYLEPLMAEGIDTLVLGCTHYPFLTPQIAEILGPSVEIIDPAVFVVEDLKRLGWQPNDPRSGRLLYQVSGDPHEFEKTATMLLGRRLAGVSRVVLQEQARAAS